jgi:uncharacterized protein (DUF1800 family)
MRSRVFLALACSAALAMVPGISAFAKKKETADARAFQQPISNSDKIGQALNRLTFGPRPGDDAKVRSIGLKKWIDQQLHPQRIAENPALVERLKLMDSLSMSSEQLVHNYPTPQMVRQMVNGTLPLPQDPEKRRMIQKLVARAEKKQGDNANTPIVPDIATLSDILTPVEIRTLRMGTPQQRLASLMALPKEKQDDVIAALPAGMRQQLAPVVSPEIRRKLQLANGPQQIVANDLASGKLLRAIYSDRQLEEVLVDFWYNHFNIFLDKGADRYLVTEYEREAIRPYVLGKFRDMLEATAKSPAMLFYLDNWQSAGPGATPLRAFGPQRRGLNENYGRELLELHTLGVEGGYTQKDVTEVARCFTGWTIDQPQLGGEFLFTRRLHDDGGKVVMGATIAPGGGIKDGEKVLDIVSRHPSTAKFISRKLAQRFVADDPPQSLVDRMAQTFTRTDGDLREVMRTMLDSKEFWSEGAFRTKLKSPLEMVVSAVRAVNGEVGDAMPLINQLQQLGEPLYRKQEPIGYSNRGSDWLNSSGLLARMNFALQLADGRMPGVKVTGARQEGIALGSPDFQKH